jgi:NAD-dependent SIR2 family protein deacetylase
MRPLRTRGGQVRCEMPQRATKNSPTWRRRQRQAQSDLCAYCEVPLFRQQAVTVEHVVPRSWGGPVGAAFNKLLVCFSCQRNKGKWESLVSHKYQELPGYGRCFQLVRYIEGLSVRPHLIIKFGPRAVLFDNILLHLQRVMHDPRWEQIVSPQRQAIFFGEQNARDQG